MCIIAIEFSGVIDVFDLITTGAENAEFLYKFTIG